MGSPMLNALSREIWFWCLTRNIFVTAVHIPGQKNIHADYFSQIFNDRTEWSLHPTVYQWATERLLVNPRIDLFATHLNTKCDRYVSWQPDPGAVATDAFSFPRSDCFYYAFPPFSLIPRVLAKVRQDQACILLIAPVWTTQVWFPPVLSLLVERPLLLPKWEDLLVLPHNGARHPLRRKIQLAAWILSSEDSRNKAFQEGLPRSSSGHGHKVITGSITELGKDGLAGVINSRLILFKRL